MDWDEAVAAAKRAKMRAIILIIGIVLGGAL